jgi:sugar phosphate isomerase/epimerase
MEIPSIRIGNQTSCQVPARLPYEFALRHGFDAFEWFSDRGRFGWCEADMDAGERRVLREEAVGHGVLFSVHAPHAANPVSSEGASEIRRSIDFAGDVAARVVNIHLFVDQGARAYADALGPLLEAARAAAVGLSLENTPQTSPEDFNAVFAVLATMPEAKGRVGVCLDMGHANLHPGTPNDYLLFVDRLGNYVPIVHWHAHENWGDRDSHLTLFTGPSADDDRGLRGLVLRLVRRGFCGSVVLEQWPQPPGLLVEARDRLLRLWDSALVQEGLRAGSATQAGKECWT